jgi:hypothetical protein
MLIELRPGRGSSTWKERLIAADQSFLKIQVDRAIGFSHVILEYLKNFFYIIDNISFFNIFKIIYVNFSCAMLRMVLFN